MDFEEVTPDNVTPDEDTERLRGRPRDPAIGDSALAAARELLAEVGWDKTTMVAISERAASASPPCTVDGRPRLTWFSKQSSAGSTSLRPSQTPPTPTNGYGPRVTTPWNSLQNPR